MPRAHGVPSQDRGDRGTSSSSSSSISIYIEKKGHNPDQTNLLGLRGDHRGAAPL